MHDKKQSLEPILSKIMTAEEYSKIRHRAPYVFEIKNENKLISYFGSRHTNDPTDPVFAMIQEKFIAANPEKVFVEGQNSIAGREGEAARWLKTREHDEIIKKMGEAGFTLKLAADHEVPFESPEPDFKKEIRYLIEQGFSKECIFAYYMFRQVPQFHRRENPGSFQKYIPPYIKEFIRATSWEAFDYSIKTLDRVQKELYRTPFESENLSPYEEAVDPIPWGSKKKSQTEINLIARASSLFRDRHIIERIAFGLKEHDRIFIVYGASHAVMQEPALRVLLKKIHQ